MINVFIVFFIVSYIVLEIVDYKFLLYFFYLEREIKYYWVWILLLRSFVLFFGFFMVIIVFYFGLFMGLVGSFIGICFCFIFFCVFYIVLKWKELRWYNIIVRVYVIVFGIICGVFGIVFIGIEFVNVVSGI